MQVQIRRDFIIEDAFSGIYGHARRLKGKSKIEFIGEAGIDGGGLFKEFMDSLTRATFDPAFALFLPTSKQLLTPNPSSSLYILLVIEKLSGE